MPGGFAMVTTTKRRQQVLDALRSSPRSRWWTTFALATIVSGSWLLATPLFGAPDEPAHSIRAASIVRGEILGREKQGIENELVVEAPGIYLDAAGELGCYVFARSIPAECAEFEGSTDLREMPTAAGRHPPAYYAIAGLPSLLSASDLGIYLMRLVGVLIMAAFVASSLASLERLQVRGIAVLGLLVATTPMVWFVSGIVNPSAVEIAAGLGLWVSGTVLALEAGTGADPRLLRRVGVAAIVLALSRQLGPLWLGLAAVTFVVIAGWPAIRRLMASRRARAWAGAALAAVVAQVAWNVIVRPVEPRESEKLVLSVGRAFRLSLGDSVNRYKEYFGWTGWLDSPPPAVTVAIWSVALAALLGVAIIWGRARLVWCAVAVAAVTVAAPVAFETVEASDLGFFWQSRYTLPFAVGVPVLLAVACALRAPAERRELHRFVKVMAVLLVVGQVLAFGQALRRNAIGYDGSLRFLYDPVWAPPLPPWLLVLGFAAAVTAFTAWALTTPGDGVVTTPSDRPAPDPSPEAAPDEPMPVRSGT